jgi:hypothetical protein
MDQAEAPFGANKTGEIKMRLEQEVQQKADSFV